MKILRRTAKVLMEIKDITIPMDMPLYIALYVGLPLLGALIAVYTIKGRYDETMREIKMELNWEKKYAKSKGKFFVFCTLELTPVVYGLTCICLIYAGMQHGVTGSVTEKIALAGGIIIGVSGFSTIIGSGLITCEAMKHIPREPYIDMPRVFKSRKEQMKFYKEHADVFKEWTFGKYMCLSTLPHTVSIFGLVLTILTFSFSGMLGSKTAPIITQSNIHHLAVISYIFAASSIGGILSGYLPTMVKGEIKEPKVFSRKIIFAAIGHLPSLFGLVICIYLMARYGML